MEKCMRKLDKIVWKYSKTDNEKAQQSLERLQNLTEIYENDSNMHNCVIYD